MVTAHAPHLPPAIRLADVNALFFDAIADGYEDWLHGVHRKVATRLVEMATPALGEFALDVGCGTGLATNGVAEEVGPAGRVVGVDVSAAMLALARDRALPNVSLYHGSADGPLWFRDGAFDLIVLCDSLTFLEEPRVALEEAYRMLRPAGRLALAVPRRSLATQAQELSRQVIERMLQTQPLTLPRARASNSLLGEPELLGTTLAATGFRPEISTTLVTGALASSSDQWLEIEGYGSPRAHILLSVAGPSMRRRLADEMDRVMRRQTDDMFRYHQAFTLVVATREQREGTSL